MRDLKDEFEDSIKENNYYKSQDFLCFYETFLISYGSLFTSSYSKKHIRLNENKIFIYNEYFKDFLPEGVSFEDSTLNNRTLKEMHSEIIQKRNRIVAHRDFRREGCENDPYIESSYSFFFDGNDLHIKEFYHYKNLFICIDDDIIMFGILYNRILKFVSKKREEIISRMEELTGKKIIMRGRG